MAACVSFLTCVRPDGRPNIMTIMATEWVSPNPPLDGVSLNTARFSLQCIRETKQFAICTPPGVLAKQLNYCGIVSGRDVDKFEALELGSTPGPELGIPFVDGCIRCCEYQVRDILPYGWVFIVAERVSEAVAPEATDPEGNWVVTPRTAPVISYTGFDYWCLGEKLWDHTTDSQQLLEAIREDQQERLGNA